MQISSQDRTCSSAVRSMSFAESNRERERIRAARNNSSDRSSFIVNLHVVIGEKMFICRWRFIEYFIGVLVYMYVGGLVLGARGTYNANRERKRQEEKACSK